MKTFTATTNDSGRTLWKYLGKMLSDVPLSRLERAFRQKDIKVNDKRIKDKKYVVKQGDVISIYGIASEVKKEHIFRVKKNFSKIYEDEHILIVSKREGQVVHDSPTSLDNQVLTYLNFIPTDSFKPSHVGRLDKVTSGLMIYGKTYKAVSELNVATTNFTKIYEFRSDLSKNITTEFKMRHDETLMKEIAGDEGKPSKTIFTIRNGRKYAELVTGRKHQIRATLAKLRAPIHGDIRYGGKKAKRVYLHSTYLKLNGLKGDLAHLNGREFKSMPTW